MIAIKKEVLLGILGIQELHCYFDDNSVIKGFIGVEQQKIEMLFVDANVRGQGIRKLLLNFAVLDLEAKYVDVNEQNDQGVTFYEHMWFVTMSRSDCDGQGRPFPILHLKIKYT